MLELGEPVVDPRRSVGVEVRASSPSAFTGLPEWFVLAVRDPSSAVFTAVPESVSPEA